MTYSMKVGMNDPTKLAGPRYIDLLVFMTVQNLSFSFHGQREAALL